MLNPMKLLPLVVCLFITICSFAQSTVLRDTLTNIHEDIEVTFSVSSVYDSTEQITIEHFNIVGTDTVSVFVGQYDVEEIIWNDAHTGIGWIVQPF